MPSSVDEARFLTIKSAYSKALAEYPWDVIKDQGSGSGWGLYGKRDGQTTDTLISLGFPVARASANVTGGEKDQSLEQLPALSDAGVIIYWKGATPDSLLANRLFTDLPAVQSRRAFPITNFAPVAYGERQSACDEVVAILEKLQ